MMTDDAVSKKYFTSHHLVSFTMMFLKEMLSFTTQFIAAHTGKAMFQSLLHRLPESLKEPILLFLHQYTTWTVFISMALH
jgi:mannose/fructose/N-acetylgalactosamine-specific phosphotransferase system component IIC